MNHWLSVLFILFASNSMAQFVLSGTVTDEDGAPLPGVKVYVESSTYGVITDYSGSYFLELQSPELYRINYSMLGMKDTAFEISITQKKTIWNVTLEEEVTELESVEVSTKKINVANQIIRKVRAQRKNFTDQFDNYTCDTYLKTGLKKEGQKDSSSTATDTITSLIESVSKTTYVAPDFYHEKIVAHHDYSDKEPVQASSPVDYFMDDIITPIQSIEVDPYIFFEKVEDGDFNLNQNMVNLPKVSEHPITSPLGIQAFTNYKFKLIRIFEENGQKIYAIEVKPRFKYAPLMEGTLYVIDELWIIKSFELSVNPSAMPFFNTFTVIHDYDQIDSNWVPIRREYIYSIKEESDYISANTRVNHSNYQFNNPISPRDFKNEIASYTDDAFSKDSTYWNDIRPIQLKEIELLFIAEQERIDSIKQSKHYLDSIDADFNRVKFWDITLNGVGFRNRYKKQEIYIAPIFESIQLFGVGGFRYNLTGSYSKQFENNHKIKLKPTLNYGFRTNDLKYALNAEYMFDPLHFGSIEIEGGSLYERLTNQTSAANYIFGVDSRILNQFGGIAYRRELVNGLYGRVKFTYSDKQPLEEFDHGPIVNYFFENDTIYDFFLPPVSFERYRAALVELKFQYRFKQSYIIKKGEKLIIGTEYPELELTYRQGIPGLFNSEISFNAIEGKISDEIGLGNYGNSKWKVIGGSFLYKKDLRIVEHKYFKEADVVFFSNPLNTHQTLDTNFNTNGLYFQAFYMHHFNGFLLNKIPLINKLKFEEVVGMSALFIDEKDFLLTEFYVGIERKFRWLGQYFKYAILYASSINTDTPGYLGFKLGFDYFNTFTNEWNW